MGQFAIVISGVGGHGCERGVKDGEHVLGCQRPDCPDCIAREFVRRYRRNGVMELKGQLIHWPDLSEATAAVPEDRTTTGKPAVVTPQGTSVIDDLVTGVRSGSF